MYLSVGSKRFKTLGFHGNDEQYCFLYPNVGEKKNQSYTHLSLRVTSSVLSLSFLHFEPKSMLYSIIRLLTQHHRTNNFQIKQPAKQQQSTSCQFPIPRRRSNTRNIDKKTCNRRRFREFRPSEKVWQSHFSVQQTHLIKLLIPFAYKRITILTTHPQSTKLFK